MRKYLYEDLYALEEIHWWHKAKREIVSKLIGKYKPSGKSKILDVGCGTGKNVEVFSKIGESWGIDNSEDALRFCVDKRGLLNIRLGEAEKTGFDEDSFDVVTLLDVLEHVSEEKTLVEIRRILKSKGVVVITVPAYQWLWSKWDEVLHHKRRYTKAQLKGVLEENGYQVIFSSYLYSFLIIPALVVRSLKSTFGKGEYASDFKLSLPIINKVLLRLSLFEQRIALVLGVPFGLSIVAVALKEEE